MHDDPQLHHMQHDEHVNSMPVALLEISQISRLWNMNVAFVVLRA